MIGMRLKLARASSGLSLRDLAERMGNVVSAQAIGKYERNEDMPGSRALMSNSPVVVKLRSVKRSPLGASTAGGSRLAAAGTANEEPTICAARSSRSPR